MPTKDRRPRRRIRVKEIECDSTIEELHAEARKATSAEWESGLRRRFVRALIAAGKKPDIATGIVHAYETKPHFIPGPPPRSFRL